MNNYDIKDCAILNNHQEEVLYESDRMNDFMATLKGELDSIGIFFINFNFRFEFCL